VLFYGFLGFEKARLRNTPYCCAVHTFCFYVERVYVLRYCSFASGGVSKDCLMYVINPVTSVSSLSGSGKLSEQNQQMIEVLPRLVMKGTLGTE
jgi:hypothetical protein